MIERSAGISTGLGYFVGNGYNGKTKELDDTVLEISKLLEEHFKKNVEIRFNSNRESGGAFLKDNEFSSKIGIGAGLESSKFHSLTKEEQRKLSGEDFEKLININDIILFHVVLDEELMKDKSKCNLYEYFNSLEQAFDWLSENMDNAAVHEYLNKIQ